MDEKELDDWYDEEKERITKERLKIIDENTEAEPRRKRQPDSKELNKRLVERMQKLRNQYQRKYDNIQTAKATMDNIHKGGQAIGGPLQTALRSLVKLFVSLWSFIKKWLVDPISNMRKAALKGWHSFDYKVLQYYTFRVRPKAFPAMWPLRKAYLTHFLRPLRKQGEQFQIWLKQTLTVTLQILQKVLTVILKYVKIISEFIGKKYAKFAKIMDLIQKKISGFIKKYISPLFAWVGIIGKIFKKKEEE